MKTIAALALLFALTGPLSVRATTTALPAEGAPVQEAAPEPSLPPPPRLDANVRDALAWQIALDRAGFSPGLIDGKAGNKTRWAATQFQLARKIPATGKLDAPTAAALGALLPAHNDVLDVYTITTEDCDSVTGVSKDWIERSKMKSLGYDTLSDALAEKFQTTQAFLKLLNPHVSIDSLDAGAKINVPSVLLAPGDPVLVAARAAGKSKPVAIEVNLTRKAVRVLDADNMPIALAHCSIAANAEKRPSGEAAVTTVALDPNYTFNPELYPEVKNVTTRLLIPPGPRNPVGVAWVGISLPGYGIHGTPWPELIGKTGSHGCIRLANWDARRIAKLARVGMPVRFVD